MRVNQRLKTNIIVSAIMAFAILLVLSIALYRVNHELEESDLASEILSSAFERNTFRTDYLSTNNERAKKQWFARHELIGKLLKAAAEKFDNTEDKKIIEEMIKDHESTGKLFSAIVENREKTGSGPGSAELSREIENRLVTQLNMRLYYKVLNARTLREAAGRHLFSTFRLAGLSIFFVIALVTAAAIINAWMMGRTIASRIGALRGGASVIGRGDLGHRIDIKGDDEFSELSDAFNAMTGKLSESYHALEAEIEERKRAEEALHRAHDELERRVAERTEELKEAKKSLELRVAERTTALQAANASLFDSRRAALNMMEDAITARMQAEEANAEQSREVSERKRAEVELLKYKDHLEDIVKERTAELTTAVAAVKTERQRFYDVLEMLPVYVVLLSPDYHVPFANRFFRERFGESCGRRCYEYLFERTEPCQVCESYTIMKTNAPHHWEWTGPDGRNYDIYDYPFKDTDGSPLIMEVGIDVSDRKQAEEALRKANETLEQRVAERTSELRESEQRLSRSQEIAHLGSWELDLVNNRLFWSDEVYRIFGLRPQEFGATYETFLEAIHPDDRASVDNAYSRSVREGRAAYEIEHRIVRKSTGEVRFVHEKCEHFRDDSGNVIRSVGMVHDITRRKIAEEEIKRHNAVLNGINRIFKQALTSKTEEELARACLQVAEAVTGSMFGFIGEIGPDGLLYATAISDPGWELCAVNNKTGPLPAGFRLHGIYGRVLLDGKSFFTNDPSSHPDSLGTPEGHPPLKSFLGVPLQQDGQTTGMIAVGNREGGYRKDELNSLETLAPVVVEALFRVRAEQKLAASLREKEVLLHEIHHRVKNNMQVISSLVNLQSDTVMDPSIREHLGEVRDRVRSMALVHEKLYQSGGLSKLDFSEYATGLLQYLWQAHGPVAANVHLKMAMQPVNLNVEESVHCGLILNELATNALKHAFKGRDEGEVTVGIEEDKATGRICLRVSDNGVGLPAGMDWRESTSMGLRLVNMLAEQMDGIVEIGDGPGTEFRLIFTARVT